MITLHQQPSWHLVTDHYTEPATCADLLALLTPARPYGDKEKWISMEWKYAQFYKRENLLPFLHYAFQTIRIIPRFHRDEIPVILRICRLCQEVGWDYQAYELLEREGLLCFVHTASSFKEWDSMTVAAAWNYLIVKRKCGQLTEEDRHIWERVKFNDSWMSGTADLVSHREVLQFTFQYMCEHTKEMTHTELEENLMQLAMYCNTYIADLFQYCLIGEYEAYVRYAAHYRPHESVLAVQRAVLAQACDFFGTSFFYLYDFLHEICEVMLTADFDFLHKYEPFIGKLLSYILFFEFMRVPSHAKCMEELLRACKEVRFKEEFIRHYLFTNLLDHFIPFLRYFLRGQRYEMIYDILFYWCSEEQREELEQHYNLHILYEKCVYG